MSRTMCHITVKKVFSLSLFLFLLFSGVSFAQTLVSIDPDSATQGSQVQVTITGNKTTFTKITATNRIQLRLGTTTINSDSFSASTDLIMDAWFTLPYSASGVFDLRVNSGSGWLTLAKAFTILKSATAPAIISIDPDTAYQGTTIVADITSQFTHFTTATTQSVRLYLGMNSIIADSAVAVNDTLLKAYFTIPIAANVGKYGVRVINNIDGTIQLAGIFDILLSPFSPRLISTYPVTAYQGQIIMVEITSVNTNFTKATTQSARLYLGANNIIADSAAPVNDTLLKAYFNIPIKSAIGLYGVRVINNIDGSVQLANVFDITLSPYAPNLISIDPDSAMQGLGLTTTIIGQYTNFNKGKNLVVRLVYGTSIINSDKISPINDTALTAHFNVPFSALLGTYELRVQDSIDGQLIFSNIFTVLSNPNQPKLVSILPNSANQGDKVKVTIKGSSSNFYSGTNLTATLILANPPINADSAKAINDSVLNAWFTIPFNAPTGVYDVRVQNTIDGQLILAKVFTIKATSNPPRIEMVDPDTLMLGQNAVVTVYGKKTQFMNPKPPTARLFQSGPVQIAADSVKVINDSILKAYFAIRPNAILGVYNMVVVGAIEGTMTLPTSVWIIPSPSSPQIGLVDPNKGMLGKKVAVSVNGKNTTFTKGTNQSVRLQRIGSPLVSPDSSRVKNDSLIIAYFTIAPTALTGPYNVQVLGTTQGTLMLPNGFEIIPSPSSPQILKVTPAKTYKNNSLFVSFITSNTQLTKSVGLRPILSFAPNSNILADSVIIVHDSMVLGHFIITAAAAVGLYDAVLQNTPSGTLMLNDCFEVTEIKKTPKIKNIDPDSIYLGQDATIRINCGATSFVKAIQVHAEISGPGGVTLASDLVKVINDSVITAHFLVPASQTTGLYSVTVSDKLDSIFSLNNALVVYDKSISIKPINLTELQVFPNPASDWIIVKSHAKISVISLYNLQGELVLVKQINDENTVNLNLGSLEKGMYLIRINTDNESILKPFILK